MSSEEYLSLIMKHSDVEVYVNEFGQISTSFIKDKSNMILTTYVGVDIAYCCVIDGNRLSGSTSVKNFLESSLFNSYKKLIDLNP